MILSGQIDCETLKIKLVRWRIIPTPTALVKGHKKGHKKNKQVLISFELCHDYVSCIPWQRNQQRLRLVATKSSLSGSKFPSLHNKWSFVLNISTGVFLLTVLTGGYQTHHDTAVEIVATLINHCFNYSYFM